MFEEALASVLLRNGVDIQEYRLQFILDSGLYLQRYDNKHRLQIVISRDTFISAKKRPVVTAGFSSFKAVWFAPSEESHVLMPQTTQTSRLVFISQTYDFTSDIGYKVYYNIQNRWILSVPYTPDSTLTITQNLNCLLLKLEKLQCDLKLLAQN